MKKKATPKKLGRPTTLTAEAEKRLLDLIASGQTMRASCKALRIRYAAVIEKREREPDFRSALARAMEHGAQACLDEAEDKLRRATSRTIAQVRELAHHLRWKAARLLRGTYGDRLELGGKVELPDAGGFEGAVAIEAARRLAFAMRMAEEHERANRLPAALPAPVESAA